MGQVSRASARLPRENATEFSDDHAKNHLTCSYDLVVFRRSFHVNIKAPKTWIPIAEAARRLDCTHTVIDRLIQNGKISVRQLPGGHPRVPAAELVRLAEASTKPAGSASPAA
jgi:excisionase family DNA binding protein